jgi:hypothetical protein
MSKKVESWRDLLEEIKRREEMAGQIDSNFMNCKDGRAHIWVKLGKVGNMHHQTCSKCGITEYFNGPGDTIILKPNGDVAVEFIKHWGPPYTWHPEVVESVKLRRGKLQFIPRERG